MSANVDLDQYQSPIVAWRQVLPMLCHRSIARQCCNCQLCLGPTSWSQGGGTFGPVASVWHSMYVRNEFLNFEFEEMLWQAIPWKNLIWSGHQGCIFFFVRQWFRISEKCEPRLLSQQIILHHTKFNTLPLDSIETNKKKKHYKFQIDIPYVIYLAWWASS